MASKHVEMHCQLQHATVPQQIESGGVKQGRIGRAVVIVENGVGNIIPLLEFSVPTCASKQASRAFNGL